MQTIYLDHSGIQCRQEGNTVVLRDAEEKRLGTLPMRNIERLIIQGDVLCSTGALTQLLEAGASILCLSKRASHRIASLHGGLHADASLRISQYQAYLTVNFRLDMARRIVHAKLRGQLQAVQSWKDMPQANHHLLREGQDAIQQAIGKIPHAPDLDVLMGLEGQAAKAYFASLFSRLPPSVSSTTRSRRPPKDPVNVLLSLGYTLAHHECIGAAYGAGLDPYIGFLHELKIGRESLACDLNEFLRRIIDAFTIHLLHEGIVRNEDFSMHNGDCLLGKAGRARYYREYSRIGSLLRRWARRYVRWMAACIRTGKLETS